MLVKADYNNFDKAKIIADMSDFKKTHIGCIAVHQGVVIGIGYNTNKTHPRQDYYNRFRYIHNVQGYQPKLHAEINCINTIRNMNIDFSKVKLYVYRKKHESFGLSRPCPSCIAAIRDLGIKHIYYTTNEGFGYERIIR